MAVVSLKIGKQFYKFSCNDGQEVHMRELAADLDKRAEHLIQSIGFMQENQLLAMMCLLLSEEKSKLEKSAVSEHVEPSFDTITDAVVALTEQVNKITESLDI
jgi:cell division protein ZapA